MNILAWRSGKLFRWSRRIRKAVRRSMAGAHLGAQPIVSRNFTSTLRTLMWWTMIRIGPERRWTRRSRPLQSRPNSFAMELKQLSLAIKVPMLDSKLALIHIGVANTDASTVLLAQLTNTWGFPQGWISNHGSW